MAVHTCDHGTTYVYDHDTTFVDEHGTTSTYGTTNVYEVHGSEFPIVPSYPHYPHGGKSC